MSTSSLRNLAKSFKKKEEKKIKIKTKTMNALHGARGENRRKYSNQEYIFD